MTNSCKRAQIFLITIWVLIIITLLALAIGNKVSLGLRLSRNRQDSFQAACIAQAGFATALNELIKDKPVGFDSLTDVWADNEGLFGKIKLNDNSSLYSVVAGMITQDGDKILKHGMIDEERKININTASIGTLTALFEKYAKEGAQEKVDSLLIWRGDKTDDNKIYESLGYLSKSGALTNTQELILVKGFTKSDLNDLRDYITVYTNGPVNINTVSYEILEVLSLGAAKELGVAESFAGSVAGKIIELRQIRGYFKNKNEIAIELTGEEETNIYNKIIDTVVFKSDNFMIEVLGNAGKIKKRITAVYNRENNRILFWHES